MTKQRLWLKRLGLLGLSLYSVSASADFYAGVLTSYSNAEYQDTTSSSFSEGNPFLLQAQAGYFINDYVAVEARYGTSVERSGGLAVDSLASGFIKFNMPVTERVALYGLTGYSSLTIDKQQAGSGKDQGFSFGIGMHYALDQNNAVVFEFVDSVSETRARLNAISLGFQHKF
ncbi:outer membrane beta-barrel protein [Vibrio sp. CAU 1672]|uniref:outer membrane beta-barrel protein n=1 Tax=Vibrio sp. CAU 1672 TaxID=3032594 RepID=UPI0023DC8EDF|nr:outer membrane beta-barrel protein [Vibrio sp. CAU 1672]MDF2153907.1 outer membrane beta-barrel protein [Vibrio sp. CAU 1672]